MDKDLWLILYSRMYAIHMEIWHWVRDNNLELSEIV